MLVSTDADLKHISGNQLPKFTLLVLLIFLGTLQLIARSPQKHSFTLTKDVVWTHVAGIDLKMDIYVPEAGRKSYPVIVVYHGGGWLINHKSDMDSLSAYLVSHADYVVCNVDYRLLGDNGNTTRINEIVEDALGAAIWVKSNISAYKGDSTKVIVTGDSAGGQLASMVTLCGYKLEAPGYGKDTLRFTPSWLPANTTRADYVAQGGIKVQAAMLSYPAIDIDKLCSSGFETFANPFWALAQVKVRTLFCDSISHLKQPQYYKAVSPLYLIPLKTQRVLPPQFCMVGSLDMITSPPYVKKYRNACKKAGQPIEFWVYRGKTHAFLSPKLLTTIIVNFTRDAPKAIDRMILFLDGIFYKDDLNPEDGKIGS